MSGVNNSSSSSPGPSSSSSSRQAIVVGTSSIANSRLIPTPVPLPRSLSSPVSPTAICRRRGTKRAAISPLTSSPTSSPYFNPPSPSTMTNSTNMTSSQMTNSSGNMTSSQMTSSSGNMTSSQMTNSSGNMTSSQMTNSTSRTVTNSSTNSSSSPSIVTNSSETTSSLMTNSSHKNVTNSSSSNVTSVLGPDYMCPLCFCPFSQPHITNCGHTYCLSCIHKFLQVTPECPSCHYEVNKEGIVPNRVVWQLMERESGNKMAKKDILDSLPDLQASIENTDVETFLKKKYNELSLSEVDLLLLMLSRKRETLLTESATTAHSLLTDFLTQLGRIKTSSSRQLSAELSLIHSDLETLAAFSPPPGTSSPPGTTSPLPPPQTSSPSSPKGLNIDEIGVELMLSGSNTEIKDKNSRTYLPSSRFSALAPRVEIIYPESRGSCSRDIGFSYESNGPKLVNGPSLAQRKVRIHSHFDELADIYFNTRRGGLSSDSNNGDQTLASFGKTLSRVSRYRGFKQLARLSYSSDLLTNSNIVSSIEFDKDSEFFAIAGVTRKIKLFEYGGVVASSVDVQFPTAELVCASKISCVAYSGYYKNRLASSDYDGRVVVWDSHYASQIANLNEHEKRVWSVDWSAGDPRLLASGSDDSKVKLWALNREKSTMTLEARANVCCVKFIPSSSYSLAFGSADHCIHVYDLRHVRQALRVYEGHKKAVSYVKWIGERELVSASTDSQLKLWSLDESECVRSYVGHTNEKNFVGLATDGHFIACGSENNSLFIYYRDLPRPLLSYHFETERSMLQPPSSSSSSSSSLAPPPPPPPQSETTEFLSAVAWRKGSPVLVAANSQGSIKVLELI